MTERDDRPTGLKHANQPMTPERKEIFLEALAASGSSVHAAAVASPEAYGARPGYYSFRDERKRDPEFAMRWQEAKDTFLGAVEAKLSEWAMKGRSRPVTNKDGEIVAYDEFPPDPRILLSVARRHDPRWNEKQTLEHTGDVNHYHEAAFLGLTPQRLMLLPKEHQENVIAAIELLNEIEANGPALIEHQPNE